MSPLSSGGAWLGWLCSSKYNPNTPQPHPWGIGDELQGPSLLGPLSPISWYKRSVCVGAAPQVPPAIHQWSCFFVQCVSFLPSWPFLWNRCIGNQWQVLCSGFLALLSLPKIGKREKIDKSLNRHLAGKKINPHAVFLNISQAILW